jgi:predicted MFS family arabinose efflux permease
VVIGYAAAGGVLAILFGRLGPRIELAGTVRAASEKRRPALLQPGLGLHRSRRAVFRLSGLFTIDAFAGGFVVQSFVASWFNRRFGVEPAGLGALFFGANVLAGVSALSAAWIARRIGLLQTMVVTHLPSNVLLLLVPFMPSLPLAAAVLLLRFSISQMDVPTRQAYTLALVEADERSAAAGVTGIARTIGASLSPIIAGPLYAVPALAGAPFLIAGGLKIAYDVLVFVGFRKAPGPSLRH